MIALLLLATVVPRISKVTVHFYLEPGDESPSNYAQVTEGGVKRPVYMPSVAAFFHQLHRPNYGIHPEEQNSQVFANRESTTIIFATGLNGSKLSADFLDYYAIGQASMVYHVGWKSMKVFAAFDEASPRFMKRPTNGPKGEFLEDHKLYQEGFMVSPDGWTVYGEFTNKNSMVFERWELHKPKPEQLGRWKWRSSDTIPKYSFHWSNGVVYWSPKTGGPLYKILPHHKPTVIARLAPFYLSMRDHIMFSFADFRKTSHPKDPIFVGNEAAKLELSRFTVGSNGEFHVSPPAWKSNFWLYPQFAQTLIHRIGNGTYYIPTTGNHSYFLNTKDRSIAAQTTGSYYMLPRNIWVFDTAGTNDYVIKLLGFGSLFEGGQPAPLKPTIAFSPDYFPDQIVYMLANGWPVSFYTGETDTTYDTSGSDFEWPFDCTTNGISTYPVNDEVTRYHTPIHELP